MANQSLAQLNSNLTLSNLTNNATYDSTKFSLVANECVKWGKEISCRYALNTLTEIPAASLSTWNTICTLVKKPFCNKAVPAFVADQSKNKIEMYWALVLTDGSVKMRNLVSIPAYAILNVSFDYFTNE